MSEIPKWSLDKAMDVLLDNLDQGTFKENKYEVIVSLYTLLEEEQRGNEKAKKIADYIREITRKNKEEK